MTRKLFPATVAAFVAMFSLAFAKPMALPGSNWTLDLPEDFSLQQNFMPTFVSKNGTAIIVFDAPPQPLKGIPAPKQGDKTDAGTDNEATLTSIEEVTVDGHNAWILQQRFEKQKSTGLTLLVEGKSSNANVVSRLTDEQLKTTKIEDLRGLFLSLKEKVLTEQERLAALPFEIKDVQGFNLAGIMGNSIAVYTDGPNKDVVKAPEQALVSVIVSPPGGGEITPEMLAIFDKQGMLQQLLAHQLPDAVVGEHKPIMAGEAPAVQIAYTRVVNNGALKLKGDMRFVAAGKQLLMIYTSYPDGDAAKEAAAQRVAASVAMRAKAP